MLQANDFEKSPLKVRLQQLQNEARTPASILLEMPVFTLREERTNTAQQIKTLHKQKLQLIREQSEWPVPATKKGMSINTVIWKMKEASKIKQSMNKHDIIYVEQLLNNDQTDTTTWRGKKNNTKKITMGRIPRWFTQITERLAEDENLTKKKEAKKNRFTRQRELVSGVIIDKKKKIHAEISELLGHQIQKEKNTKTTENIQSKVLTRKENQNYEMTRLFPEMAEELWKIYRESKLPKTIKTKIGIQKRKEESRKTNTETWWVIEDITKRRLVKARAWPSTLKNSLIALAMICICVKHESKVKMNAKNLKQILASYMNLLPYQNREFEKNDL
ncbi:hypothetical protein C2G38_2221367 [Gigaspora rosea]|uniref:Uncharacterized protein n=1 Tax=Gigaspora rosea TaxID=44941 RepID=A0A397U3I5_9GLOM|nr:hypothetical protein C2G38_2221367 [Gigaspora rosea]